MDYSYVKDRKIGDEIRLRLQQVALVEGRQQKILEMTKFFMYLSTPELVLFINKHKTFKNTVADKLIELRDEEHLKEAKDWWQNIFKHKMLY